MEKLTLEMAEEVIGELSPEQKSVVLAMISIQEQAYEDGYADGLKASETRKESE